MRIEALFLLGVGLFFGLVGTVYWFTAYEDGGTMMLVGTCLLGLLPGSYYFYWHRRMGNRPEDRSDATIEDGAGVVGSFPGSSIWPFILGAGAFFAVLALTFGAWLIFIGASLVITALIGVTAESRRGGRV
jgi:Cytochrome c oxidase subunit IV